MTQHEKLKEIRRVFVDVNTDAKIETWMARQKSDSRPYKSKGDAVRDLVKIALQHEKVKI